MLRYSNGTDEPNMCSRVTKNRHTLREEDAERTLSYVNVNIFIALLSFLSFPSSCFSVLLKEILYLLSVVDTAAHGNRPNAPCIDEA